METYRKFEKGDTVWCVHSKDKHPVVTCGKVIEVVTYLSSVSNTKYLVISNEGMTIFDDYSVFRSEENARRFAFESAHVGDLERLSRSIEGHVYTDSVRYLYRDSVAYNGEYYTIAGVYVCDNKCTLVIERDGNKKLVSEEDIKCL